MEKKQAKTIAAILILGIIIVSGFLYLNNLNAFAFSFEKEKVLFASNEAEPMKLMQEFNLNDTVFISSVVFESGTENAYLAGANNLLSIVFIGNDKNTVSLWRVIDRKGTLLSCRTNNGDVRTDTELTASECNNILEDKNNAIVMLSQPATDKKAIVLFSTNRIEIVPASFDKSSNAAFVFLKTMYANAELIIQKANAFTKYLQ